MRFEIIIDEGSLVGKQLGSYRLVSAISSGSYGSVYQAKHLVFEDEPVAAVKVLHAHLGSPQEHETFLQEARILKKLSHPSILSILDAGVQDGLPYLITEYAPGGSLRDRLRQQHGQPLDLSEALSILTQIGAGLHEAHQQQIVHRDLKPENILFNAQGTALLADFGIATYLISERTQQVDRLGTPAYMAPEQFEGMASPKSDQYALSCIAYELLTGRRLFAPPRPSLETLWYHHAKIMPPAPTLFNPSLPSWIEQAILKALAKERKDRHPDIAAFMTQLCQSSSPGSIEITSASDQERNEEALAVDEQALRNRDRLALGYLQEGDALLRLQHYEQALAAYEQAIGLFPENAEAYIGQGSALFRLQRYTQTLQATEQALQLNPKSDSAYHWKSNALFRLGRHTQALAAAEQALQLNAKSAWAHNARGNALGALGRDTEALASYETATVMDPHQPDILFNKGRILLALQHYQKAIRESEQLLRLSPNDGRAYFLRGEAFFGMRQYRQAIAVYDQVLRSDIRDPSLPYASIYHKKALVLNTLADYEEALEAAEQALRLTPVNPSVQKIKAEALHGLGRDVEALSVYDLIVSVPANATDLVYCQKAMTLLELKRYEEALTASDTARHINPLNTLALDIKGTALYELERYEEALVTYGQALLYTNESRIVNNKDTLQRYLKKKKWHRLLGRPLEKPRISPPGEEQPVDEKRMTKQKVSDLRLMRASNLIIRGIVFLIIGIASFLTGNSQDSFPLLFFGLFCLGTSLLVFSIYWYRNRRKRPRDRGQEQRGKALEDEQPAHRT
jgi:serine/threonine protein kinase